MLAVGASLRRTAYGVEHEIEHQEGGKHISLLSYQCLFFRLEITLFSGNGDFELLLEIDHTYLKQPLQKIKSVLKCFASSKKNAQQLLVSFDFIILIIMQDSLY